MKYPIKMIVSDLDGTLLRSDKSVSEYTRSILRKCREAGIKVAYATARGGSAERVVPSEMFDARIMMNGAVAYADDGIVYNRLIPYNTARPVLLACDRRGLMTASECSGMHYTNYVVSDIWPEITNFKIVDFALHDKDAEKLYAVVNGEEDVDYIKRQLPGDLYITVSSDMLGMIMHREATKSKALAALARTWNIDAAEIAAFGDELNDIDMLSWAGFGVAMENALGEVKAAARHSCRSNDRDGVAVWIAENVL